MSLSWHLWQNSTDYADPSLMTRQPRIAEELWRLVRAGDLTPWHAWRAWVETRAAIRSMR